MELTPLQEACMQVYIEDVGHADFAGVNAVTLLLCDDPRVRGIIEQSKARRAGDYDAKSKEDK